MKQVGLVVGAVLVIACFFSEVLRDLLFGWFTFLARVLPRVAPDGPSVAVGLASLVLLTAGIHAAGRAWRGAPAGDGTSRSGWKLRWSLAGVAGVVLLFAAGTCVIALVHQVGWLATAPEPLHVPALKRNTEGSSANNLKWIGFAVANHEGTDGALPPGGTFAPDGSMRHGWAVYLLPFLNYSAKDIDMNRPWNDPANQKYFRSVLPEFINPQLVGADLTDAEGYGLNHYSANSHLFRANRCWKPEDSSEGLSNTLLVGEINAGFKPWGHPANWRDPERGINTSPEGFGGPRYAGGANFVMGDGSVRFVSERVSPDVLKALAGRDEKVGKWVPPPR